MATTASSTEIHHRLEDLSLQVQRRRSGATERDAERLATALLWDDKEIQKASLFGTQRPTRVAKGFIANQPAAVFFGNDSLSSRALLHGAALFAYHCSVEWGVIASRDEITILNSHWVRAGDWFSLPPISWRQIPNYMDVFEGITPDGLTHGRIEVVATRFAQPDRLLRAVDDALVERLDYWRGEAARHSKRFEAIDEKLHTLFAQLFVLRAAEDRGLTANTPALSTALSARGLNSGQLKTIFDQAKIEIQSELFDAVDIAAIPEFILAGIINDLYFPKELPMPGARYNFALIDADVLGRAYEKYLSNVIATGQPSRQLLLLDQPIREIERLDARKSSGIYYTPQYLVHFLTNGALDAAVNNIEDFPNRIPKIADASCGSGSFLTTAVTNLVRRLRAHNPSRNWGRELVRRKCIVGVDRDARAVALARLSLWLRLAEEVYPHILREITHFFSIYKDLEGKRVHALGWHDRDVAQRVITEAHARFRGELKAA